MTKKHCTETKTLILSISITDRKEYLHYIIAQLAPAGQKEEQQPITGICFRATKATRPTYMYTTCTCKQQMAVTIKLPPTAAQ